MKQDWNVSSPVIKSLELGGMTPGEPFVLASPALPDAWLSLVDNNEALGQAALVSAIRARVSACQWQVVSHSPLGGPGLQLQCSDELPGVMHVRDRDQKVIQLTATNGNGEPVSFSSYWQDPQVPHEAFFWRHPQDRQETHLLLSRYNGLGCLLRASSTGWEGWHLFPALLQSEQVEPFPTDTITSAIDVKDDSWLQAEVAQRLDDGSDWEIAVAVGLCGRLRQTSPAQTRSLISALLAGRPDPSRQWPWQWALDLSSQQSQRLQDLMTAHLILMGEELSLLEDALSFQIPYEEWLHSLRSWLYRRDDAECVLALLRKRGESDAVMPALEPLDTMGRALLWGLPVISAWAEDERFQRILAYAPEAWWAQGGDDELFVPGASPLPHELLRGWALSRRPPEPQHAESTQPAPELEEPTTLFPVWPLSLLQGTPPAKEMAIAAQAGSPFDASQQAPLVLEFTAETDGWRARLTLTTPAYEESEIHLVCFDASGLPVDISGSFDLSGLTLEVAGGRAGGPSAAALRDIWLQVQHTNVPLTAVLRVDDASTSLLLQKIFLGQKLLFSL